MLGEGKVASCLFGELSGTENIVSEMGALHEQRVLDRVKMYKLCMHERLQKRGHHGHAFKYDLKYKPAEVSKAL